MAAESTIERRQVNLPGTRFSQPFPSFASLPGSRLTVVDPTQTQRTSSSSSPITYSSTSTSSVNPTPSTSSMGPPMQQAFNFLVVPNPMTCKPATFTWNYVGSYGTFSLTLEASNAPHTDFPGARRAVNNRVIATSVQNMADTWTWQSVDTPQGWYQVQAVGDSGSWTATSSQFYVTNGTDVSCLLGTSPSPSPSSSSPSSVPSTSSATSTDSSSSSSTSTAVFPAQASTSNRARTGAIAGGVVGGLIIIGAAIVGYIYFGLCRRTPTRSRRRALDGAQPQLGKWGGLSSRDSGMDAPIAGAGKPALAMALPPKKRGKTESTSAMLSPVSPSAHAHSVAGQAVSDEDLATLADEEKDYKGQEFIETVPPLVYSRRRSSVSGNGGNLGPITSIPEPPPSAGSGSMGRHRTRSSSQSHRAMAFAKLDGSDPTSASRARSPSVSQGASDNPLMAMPANPQYNASPMNRSSSAGGQASRRSMRKPVPLLDSSEVPVPPTPTSPGVGVSRGQSRASTVTTPSTATPTSAHPMYRNESHSSSSARLRASAPAPARQRSREEFEAVGMELPNLNHKSSFGDRPVHYLIPDMPPPPRR